ncbi:uncharacterized protein [Malus domestica]|uniref:uncharacterized protein n=1 Tax=Malus domestica TaxID=3750 RepID=UPI003976CC0B
MVTDKATESFVQPTIPRFDGHYDHWSMLMENFLKSYEYWNLVESGIDAPAEGVVLTEQQKRVAGQKLNDLKKKYEGSERVKRVVLQTLTRDFETLQMKSGESITDFFARTLGIASKMRSNCGTLEEVKVVENIVRSLTPTFDYIVYSIEEAKDVAELRVDELQSSLLVHEQRLNRTTASEEQIALKASTCFLVIKFSRRKRSWKRSGQFGHYKNECYMKLPNEKGEKSNFVEKKEEETLLIAFHALIETNQETWYVDTGCSNHMSRLTKKIVVSKDVIFDEDTMWNWSENISAQQQIPVDDDSDKEDVATLETQAQHPSQLEVQSSQQS